MIDLPFSGLLDTVLLPYDYFQADDIASQPSPKKRVQDWENYQATDITYQSTSK
ncbi:YceK/YidQ family lipoprotein [Arsenophonus endosymbiont of Bemisia tabaci]|uniref:YceK/YidQ family lipoprotein n=1 Tax=Arsenophonus endosymbiont of Bemisia tabaci TaxID=536059 RepID=UPI001EE28ED9|nr:YceK/YidQ family lipoprotein [Arsenophonus endosymbiont of Bemisia tabaci]